MDRRQFLQTGGLCGVVSLSGCLSAAIEPAQATNERIYTCSYDAAITALADSGGGYDTIWTESRSDQTTDIQVDRNDDVLVCNRGDGLEKWRDGDAGIHPIWQYDGLTGSIRGVSVDRENDYYLGSWDEHGFHKIVEVNGEPRQAWTYTWGGDDGMVSSAPSRTGEVAIGLKNNEVHLLGEANGEPQQHWTWTPETGGIVRELLWGPDDELYLLTARESRRLRRHQKS